MRTTSRVVCTIRGAAVIVSASPCASGTLSSYIALGGTGCTVGTTLFNNFAIYHPALTFGIADFADIDIAFKALSPAANGLIAPSFTDPGSVTATHDTCPSGTSSGGVCSASDFNGIAIASDAFTDVSEGRPFSPASNASFMADIGVDATGGSARVPVRRGARCASVLPAASTRLTGQYEFSGGNNCVLQ